MEDHSLDCINPCLTEFCHILVPSRLKATYIARFNFQSVIALRTLPDVAEHVCQLIEQWNAALTILQEAGNLNKLNTCQVRFYSTCSENPIFNNVPSAILSEAIGSYLHPQFPPFLARGISRPYHLHPVAFWLALGACVLEDL